MTDAIFVGGKQVDELYLGAAKLWPAAAAALPGLGGWAEVSDTPTSSYTDGNGFDWNVWTFTADGVLNVSKDGLLDCLIVGGGAASGAGIPSGSGNWPGNIGQGGRIVSGLHRLLTGALAVTVGAAGTPSAAPFDRAGRQSSIGALATGPSVTGIDNAGTMSSITGVAIAYGGSVDAPAANLGQGDIWHRGAGPDAPGSTGVVIVRRPA